MRKRGQSGAWQIQALWKKNRVYFWLFFIVFSTFVFTLIWTRLMIFEALQQNVFVSSNEKLGDKDQGAAKINNHIFKEEEIFVLNDAQKNFDELNFLISADGQSIAYIFNDTKFNKKTLALNGRAGASYDDIIFMKFSPNGQRFAYGTKVNGKSLVVLDGQEGKIYDWIFEPRFFTPDNQYFVYKARDDRGDFLVFNTDESQAYDRIYGMTVNNSQTELIFFARKGDRIWRGQIDLNKLAESNF